ncbi:hypothetical protein V8B97DRAFT_1272093 [Scleroderma yunnanense]
MFSFVARLRRLAPLLFIFTPLVAGRDNTLFTSSVTYCSEPDALLIQQFEVTYFQKNSSVWFNISAASVQPNVSVSANIMLNVYGMHPVNFTIDLCSLFNGALCPLPTYNFTGSDTVPLPSSLGVNEKIPGIAFKIPDLEAYAQLTLTEVNTGVLKACVQATLSNGWSAHQLGVEWATAGLGILALLSAIRFSVSWDSITPIRFVDLFSLYQWVAWTALLDLNYPSVYRAFATNFAWAVGLFSASANSSIQLSINNMRHLTGGTMADASGGSAVALVNRKLSPYNAMAAFFVSANSHLLEIKRGILSATSTYASTSDTSPATLGIKQLDSAGAVQLVTSSSSNVLQAGIPIYVNYIGIATANAFMTIFLAALMLFAILLAALAAGYGILILGGRLRKLEYSRSMELKHQYPAFSRAWILRVCLIVFPPVSIFAMYQWTLNDSWLSILLSVILLLAVGGYLLHSAILPIRLAIADTPQVLYIQSHYRIAYGPLFALYRPERYYAYVPLLMATLVKAAFTAFAHTNGVVQIVAFVVIEATLLFVHLFLRPHRTRGAKILETYLAITRVLCTGLLVAFIEPIGLGAIPRVIIGIVIAVIISVAVIVMFFNTLVNLGIPIFRRGLKSPADISTLEKGASENDNAGRPVNPTPERMIPLDPAVNQPYPESPSHLSAETESNYTQESGSTTLGSLLPRRWSLQPSQPSHSRTTSQSHSSHFMSTNPSSPHQSHPPSPLHSQLHSRPPTNEHSPIQP